MQTPGAPDPQGGVPSKGQSPLGEESSSPGFMILPMKPPSTSNWPPSWSSGSERPPAEAIFWYEYEAVVSEGGGLRADDLTQKLTSMASQGWRLHTIFEQDDRIVMVFERLRFVEKG